jgi:hypothetical protein
MAWTYSDWITETTDALKLTALQNHIAEVSARIAEDMSSSPGSVSYGNLLGYLKHLQDQEQRIVQRSSAARFTRARMT